MKIFFLVLSVLVFCLSDESFSQQTTPEEVNDMVLGCLDLTTDPCSDFYQFACGGWIAANLPIPPSATSVDKSFTTIENHNNAILLGAVTDPANAQLYRFNEACLDRAAINEQGFLPASPDFQAAGSISDLSSFLSTAADLTKQGYSSILWSLGVAPNAMQPTVNVLQMDQGGISLPYPDLYLALDNQTLAIQKAYQQYIANLFVLTGMPESSALQLSNSVFAFEKQLASFAVSGEVLFDPFVAYNNFTDVQLQNLMPDLPLYSYFANLIGQDYPALTVIDAPPFFSNLSSFVANSPISDLSAYLMFKVANEAAPLLSDAFVQLYFSFWGTVLEGEQEMPSVQDSCLNFANEALPDLLGSAFVSVAFPPSAVKLATQMVTAIEDAFGQDLATVSWMDNITRARALQKHAQLLTLIGYPQNPQNYSSVAIGTSFWDNMAASASFQFSTMLSRLGTAVDRTLWEMPAQTINAYYDPTLNDLVMIAGIMQQPYFDPTQVYPLPMQFGGSGVIAGHESTHSMDSEGADYSGDGQLTDWWEPQTRANFQERVQCVINQYNQYEVLPGVYVNGQLTQGENVADLGGVHVSYNALLSILGEEAMNQPNSVVPKFTNAQLFFVAYAQGWCAASRPEAVLEQIHTDPHSPPKFRVIGPLQDSYAFAEAFSCPVGSYMNPPTKCQVW